MRIPLPMFVDPVTNQESFSMTAAALTLGIVLFKVALGGMEFWGHKYEYIADSTITTLLTPTLILYFSRKATTAAETVALAKVDRPAPSPTSTSNVAINIPPGGAP
jgi:hypothetical protein